MTDPLAFGAGGAEEPERFGIEITPRAAEKARMRLARRGTPGAAIRVGLRGGGCSGFSYVIEYDDAPPRPRDRVYEVGGARFYVDPKSLVYLSGATLDWHESVLEQGFKFVNPHEKASCGCGKSFSV